MYANKNYKTDGKVYYMPNKIFDENFSPHEFMIYCFLVSVGDSKGVSFLVCSEDGKEVQYVSDHLQKHAQVTRRKRLHRYYSKIF